jgi:CelD/BcsL family acetyltransferase involved in cellulose biosynthesis
MRTELLTDTDALRRLRDPWHALHAAAEGTIFQTYDWLWSWWTIYGSRFGLRILALWQDGDLAGLVPCYVDRNALGAYARSMGEHAVFGAYAPLIRSEAEEECTGPTAAFFARLLRVDRCGFIDYHHVPSPSAFLERLGPAMNEEKCLDITAKRSLPRLVVQLPSTWEEYVKALSPHERHFARMVTRFETRPDPPFTVRVRRDPAALDDLIRLHSHVWEERGQRGYFKGREGFADFFRALLPGLLAREAAAFYTIEAGGEVVATTVAFFTGRQSCAYLSGRLAGHPVKKYSPGKALLTAIIRDSIRSGFTSCDLMEGLTEYKFRVGGGLSWFSRHTIVQSGLRGAQGRAFLGFVALRSLWNPKRLIRRIDSVRRYGHD